MIHKAIIAIMEEIGAIGKNQENTQQHFKYRGIDDVMNALHPLLVKHKVFLVPEILEQTREERKTKSGGNLIYSVCKIKYTFYAEDGSKFESIVVGEGMDSGDKATNKAMAIAFKYVCFQVFCIPTGEDPDSESHELDGFKNMKSPFEDTQKKTFNGDNIHYCEDCDGEILPTSKSDVETLIAKSQKWYQANLCGPCSGKRYKETHPDA